MELKFKKNIIFFKKRVQECPQKHCLVYFINYIKYKYVSISKSLKFTKKLKNVLPLEINIYICYTHLKWFFKFLNLMQTKKHILQPKIEKIVALRHMESFKLAEKLPVCWGRQKSWNKIWQFCHFLKKQKLPGMPTQLMFGLFFHLHESASVTISKSLTKFHQKFEKWADSWNKPLYMLHSH